MPRANSPNLSVRLGPQPGLVERGGDEVGVEAGAAQPLLQRQRTRLLVRRERLQQTPALAGGQPSQQGQIHGGHSVVCGGTRCGWRRCRSVGRRSVSGPWTLIRALAAPLVGRGRRDLEEAGALEDRPGELGRVAVDVALAVADRRPGPRRGQGAVDAPAAVLGSGGAAPDAGELGAVDRLEAAGADDLRRRARRPTSPCRRGCAAGAGSARPSPLPRRRRRRTPRPAWRTSRRTSRLVGDLADDHAVGQVDVDGEQLGLADHDRLGLVGGEAVGDEGVVQTRGVVVAAGLPLDPGDLGHRLVVREGLLDQLRRPSPRWPARRRCRGCGR